MLNGNYSGRFACLIFAAASLLAVAGCGQGDLASKLAEKNQEKSRIKQRSQEIVSDSKKALDQVNRSQFRKLESKKRDAFRIQENMLQEGERLKLENMELTRLRGLVLEQLENIATLGEDFDHADSEGRTKEIEVREKIKKTKEMDDRFSQHNSALRNEIKMTRDRVGRTGEIILQIKKVHGEMEVSRPAGAVKLTNIYGEVFPSGKNNYVDE